MIFVIAGLGVCAYLIEPLLFLEPDQGLTVFTPLVLAVCLIAGLTGYAIRTGPPVPRYFLIGPVIITPLLGLALFSLSVRQLWILVGVNAVLCLLALLRRSYAVTRGIEEAQSEESEAKLADEQILDRIGEKIEKKFQI